MVGLLWSRWCWVFGVGVVAIGLLLGCYGVGGIGVVGVVGVVVGMVGVEWVVVVYGWC